MRVEHLEMLNTIDQRFARDRLIALIACLSDADAAALWALIRSWYVSPQPPLKSG